MPPQDQNNLRDLRDRVKSLEDDAKKHKETSDQSDGVLRRSVESLQIGIEKLSSVTQEVRRDIGVVHIETQEVRTDIVRLRSEIEAAKAESESFVTIAKFELKAAVEAVRNEAQMAIATTRTDIAAVKAENRSDRRVLSLQVGGIISVLLVAAQIILKVWFKL